MLNIIWQSKCTGLGDGGIIITEVNHAIHINSSNSQLKAYYYNRASKRHEVHGYSIGSYTDGSGKTETATWQQDMASIPTLSSWGVNLIVNMIILVTGPEGNKKKSEYMHTTHVHGICYQTCFQCGIGQIFVHKLLIINNHDNDC